MTYTVGMEVKFVTSAEVAIPAKFSLFPTGSMEGSQSARAPSEPCPALQSAQTHSINHGRIMHSGCACDKEWWSAEHRPGFACRFVHLYFSRATWRICRTWGGTWGWREIVACFKKYLNSLWLSNSNARRRHGKELQDTAVPNSSKATQLLLCLLLSHKM